MGGQVLADLLGHRWTERQAKRGDDEDLVFNDNTNEPPSLRNITRRHFKPILKKAELPDIRIYDLRHTCATLLLASGEHPKVVADRLGHASTKLTMDTYSHVLPSMQQGATDRLEQLLNQDKERTS